MNPKKIKYKPLFEHTQRFIKSINAVLWKAKSHTTPKQQFYNKYADILADYGRCHPHNAEDFVPNVDSMANTVVNTFQIPYGDDPLYLSRQQMVLRVESRGISLVFDRGR